MAYLWLLAKLGLSCSDWTLNPQHIHYVTPVFWGPLGSKTHAPVVHKTASNCFHLYLLCMKNIWQQNISLFKIACKCNLSALGFCQLFHFGFIAPACQKHEEWTNVLLGLSTSVGEWSISSTADYITLPVHLCLTGGAPPPAMKRQSTASIWSDSLAWGRQPSQSDDSCLQSAWINWLQIRQHLQGTVRMSAHHFLYLRPEEWSRPTVFVLGGHVDVWGGSNSIVVN